MYNFFPGEIFRRHLRTKFEVLVSRAIKASEVRSMSVIVCPLVSNSSSFQYRALCTACNKSISVSGQGKQALYQHAKGPAHKEKAAIKFGRSSQPRLAFLNMDEQPDEGNEGVNICHVAL